MENVRVFLSIKETQYLGAPATAIPGSARRRFECSPTRSLGTSNMNARECPKYESVRRRRPQSASFLIFE